jgi:threonine aldolase
MGNLASVLAHCGRGDEVILGDISHTYLFEAGGIAALGGVHPRVLRNAPDGTLALVEIASAVREDDEHFPVSRLVCLETTHNRCRGAALPVDYIDAVGELAHARGLKLHIDGARLWNAHVATGASLADLTDGADSVSVCFSKGLGAPVGSMVVGTKDFIWEARRVRKVLGGGMRQVGVLAAAANCALDESLPLLKHDHARAKQLAAVLAETRFLSCDPATIETNIVRGEIGAGCPFADAPAAMAGLAEHKVRCVAMGKKAMRFVLHRDVDDEDVARASEVFRKIAKR